MAGGRRPSAVGCRFHKATRRSKAPMMTEERPRRQRTVQSTSEFSRGGLLHTEELQLRRALYASLKDVKTSYNRKRRLREPRKKTDTFTCNKPVTTDDHSRKSKSTKKESKDVKRTRVCRSRRETALNGLPKKISEQIVRDEETSSTNESREKNGGKRTAQDLGTSLGLGHVESRKRRKCLESKEEITKEKTSSASDDCISENSFQVSAMMPINGLHRKLKRRARRKRQVANNAPTEEMYFPANLGKTEDFLTFLCLRGNSSLPRTFDIFNHPSHFCTPAALFIDETAYLCPTFPSQSSITYSPSSSSILSDSSAASPMSSSDSWSLSDE